MSRSCSIYMTFADPDEAKRIARTLVEERLVACVNILPGALSLYRWQGTVQEDPEVVAFAKTRADRAEAVFARVRELHGYDTPCLVALPLAAGDADYLAWIEAEVGRPEAPDR